MSEAVNQRVENRQRTDMLAVLVMGDRNENERADGDVFRATVMVNLMDISGLHSTLFVWLVSVGSGLVATLCEADVPALASHFLPATPGLWGARGGGFKLIATIYFSRFFP